jgi:hypothetical protein
MAVIVKQAEKAGRKYKRKIKEEDMRKKERRKQ